MMPLGYPTASYSSPKEQMYFSPNTTAAMPTSCLLLLALPADSDFPQMGRASGSRSASPSPPLFKTPGCLLCGKFGRTAPIYILCCYLIGTILRRSVAGIGHLTERTSYSKVLVMGFPAFGLWPTSIRFGAR